MRHTSASAAAQPPGHDLVYGRRVPAACVQLLQQPARRVFDPVEDIALGLHWRLRSCEKRRQRGRIACAWRIENSLIIQASHGCDGSAQAAYRAIVQAQHGEHQPDTLLAGRCLAQGMQPIANLGILQLAQIAVHVQQEVVKIVRGFCGMQVVMQIGLYDEVPDLRLDGRQLAGVEGLHLVILVHELFQPGDVVVHLGPHHGRDEMVDHHGMRAPFGLGAFAGVVDDEGIDQGQVTQRQIRIAGG